MVSIKFESQYYHVWKGKRLHGKNNKINRENDLKKRKNCAIQRKQRACIDINFAKAYNAINENGYIRRR